MRAKETRDQRIALYRSSVAQEIKDMHGSLFKAAPKEGSSIGQWDTAEERPETCERVGHRVAPVELQNSEAATKTWKMPFGGGNNISVRKRETRA